MSEDNLNKDKNKQKIPPPYWKEKNKDKQLIEKEKVKMTTQKKEKTKTEEILDKAAIADSAEDDDFDFVDHYGDDVVEDITELLPDNTASCAINCAFVGIGGGGGKIAKSFLDLGFNRTILINTTHKDQPEGIAPQHFLLLDGSDGLGKDVSAGKALLDENTTLIEDTLRARLGKVDWLFVCASGGGGTGSSSGTLHDTFNRYLDSVQANGEVVYIVSIPTSQECLNPTIQSNADILIGDISSHPHVVIDNERQLQLLRGKVGMLGMYPAANKALSKMISQVFKLATESSPIQTFDTSDLEKCLKTPGRMFFGTIAIRDFSDDKLGLKVYKGVTEKSPCQLPIGKSKNSALLLVVSSQTASDPVASNHLESAISYVGGRSDTLFSGVYVRNKVPGLVAIAVLCGLS